MGGVQPELAVNLDLFIVNHDLRRVGRRWIGLCIRDPVGPRTYRAVRSVDAEPLEDRNDLANRRYLVVGIVQSMRELRHQTASSEL